ncbi:flagellar protein FlaG [Alteromonas sp. KUL49]|uniref:flagellar protein FlaG n=1 Tax=Alteromonas sp. KUL49 TaxID=2480798 RepID=UPI00102EF9C2|nr:flagellar protein FlaG [Alteromonas sp. KUL49]TAP39663.1 flagellar protein FlaG [Alteromonas sp. KUL49]GEA11648.1 hypothetical protein KUL49_20230 [Alteromonas sp. KUL49]
MEIVSNQFGQNFASDVVAKDAANAPAQPRQNAVVETAPEEQQNLSDQQPGRNSVDFQQSTQQTSNNTTQASTNSADISIREVESESLNEAVREVESFLQTQNRNLTFSVDEETSKSVVTVKDSESGDVIRQIPSEEVLKLAERIQELQQDVGSSVGVFINNEV